MRWTERQRAMLREIGVQLWERRVVAEADAPGLAPATPRLGAESGAAVALPAAALAAAESGSAVALPAAAQAPARRPAECLVVGDADEAAESGGPGDADRLLARMLDAAQLSFDAPGPARRACRLALPSGSDLEATIAQVRPRAILALGRAAAQALLGSDEPLGRLRGRLHECAGLPLVVSLAPAYLLRHPEEKAKAWADLCLLAGALEPNAG